MDHGGKGVFHRRSNLSLMLWTAFILGFAGSLHCLGMCSPLAMAVTNMYPRIVVSRLLYNGGRIFMYGVLGSIIASVGFALPMTKYQNLLSIVLGIALLVIAITGVSGMRIPLLTNILERFSLFLKKLFSKFIQKRSNVSTFVLGSLNGVLPCGLSFLALTYCLTLAGPKDGFVFMLVFGAGTLPVMLGFASLFLWTVNRFNISAKKLTTGMLILSGMLLIGRVFFVHLPHTHSIHEALVDIVICK